MDSHYTLRRATPDDAPIIVHQRRQMFEAIDTAPPVGLDAMDAAILSWLRVHIAHGDYVGLLACDAAGAAVAGVGIYFYEWLPNPFTPKNDRAYIMNVYTEPEHRKRGLARRLMLAALDECRARAFRMVSLHASEYGRALYAELGFRSTNEMRIDFTASI